MFIIVIRIAIVVGAQLNYGIMQMSCLLELDLSELPALFHDQLQVLYETNTMQVNNASNHIILLLL